MGDTHVAVVGDLILDHYVWGRVARISPEAPVPIVRVERESSRLGGAANVAWNLASLGARVELGGVVGADAEAKELLSLLADRGIAPHGLHEDLKRSTTLKTRVIAHQQQVVRTDRETDAPLPEAAEKGLAAFVHGRAAEVDGVLVQDYGKGVVTGAVMDAVRDACSGHGVPFLVDPKEGTPALYRGARCLTPNRGELKAITGLPVGGAEETERAARSLREEAGAGAVVVTLGEEGMALVEGDGPAVRIPAFRREVFDVTGCGDTVSAVLTLATLAGASLEEAAWLASCAAAHVVGRLGTAAPAPEELLEAADRYLP
jgi:D-beta-D-heptose 7-phosphate kinase/D-beta-D-heptose 1-phosphate adenosyltransferase